LEAWIDELPQNYVDKNFIILGIACGFNIVRSNQIKSNGFVKLRNHTSATNESNKMSVEKTILSEIMHGRYILASSRPNIISPLGAIVKHNHSIRLIHDCSRPEGHCLNDYAIPFTVHYQTIEDVKQFLSDRMFMAKMDLMNAYRSVKINPTNYCATGLAWTFTGDTHGTILIDTC
jgi:hypothetical protein